MFERTRDGLAAARARGRIGGQKPKLTARQAKIAQAMYDELGDDGRRAHTVQQIADELASPAPRSIATLSVAPDRGREGDLSTKLSERRQRSRVPQIGVSIWLISVTCRSSSA
jgi:hypothetical protein